MSGRASLDAARCHRSDQRAHEAPECGDQPHGARPGAPGGHGPAGGGSVPHEEGGGYGERERERETHLEFEGRNVLMSIGKE